jgi:hypothetical protein
LDGLLLRFLRLSDKFGHKRLIQDTSAIRRIHVRRLATNVRMKIVAHIVVALLMISLATTGVIACECPYGTHPQNFRWSQTIFAGEVISVSASQIVDQTLSRAPLHAVAFRVEKTWKGPKRLASRSQKGAQSTPRCGSD